ncbi:hypothetical protein ACTFIU_005670 [Dictyostelium citrinum]
MNNTDKFGKDIMYMSPIDSKFFFKPSVVNDNNSNNNNINNNNNYNNLINTNYNNNINNKNNYNNSNSVFSLPDQAATITNISNNTCILASPTPSSPSNKLLMIQRDDMEKKDINDYSSNTIYDHHQTSKPSYHHHSHHSHHSHHHHNFNNPQLQNLQNFQQHQQSQYQQLQNQQKPISPPPPPPSSLNIVVNRNRFFENSDPNFSYFSHNESNISDFFYNYVHYDHNFNFNENSFIFNSNININNNNNEINNSAIIGNDILQTVVPQQPTPPPQQFTQIKNTNYIFVPQQLKQ